MTFEEMGLSPALLKGIKELNFMVPSPIQAKVIPQLLESGRDLVALAQTGTGKTAAFGLPILDMIDLEKNSIQCLILCPTRELCMQIHTELEKYSKYLPKVFVAAVYGGANIETQIKQLQKGVHIVVGTPGRITDLIERKKLKVDNIRYLVLDEADEMLDMGFKDDLDFILQNTPENRQTLLFSATMPAEIRKIANNYMSFPEEISAGVTNVAADNVLHHYYMVHEKDRYLALKRIADINPDIYGIIFCRTRAETKLVADKLIEDGYNADALHGDLSQAQRDSVMNKFRNKSLQLLVATDVAARGIDVKELTHIINYNLPEDLEVYIHRSGRTGRAGKHGVSIAIINPKETYKIQSIERFIKKKFERVLIPDGVEICKKRLISLIDRINNIEVIEKDLADFMPEVLKKLEHLNREELLKRFVSVEFNRFLAYYKTATDLNVSPDQGQSPKSKVKNEREGDSRRGRSGSDTNYTRFFLNVGSIDKINPGKIIELINRNVRNRDIEIGKIDVMKNFSFFEVDSDFEKDILNGLEFAKYNGNPISVEIAKPTTGGDEGRSSKDNKHSSDNRDQQRGGGKRDQRKRIDRSRSGRERDGARRR
ncbi:MAG: DEAD/DEAH box helicase [Bacteroidales bacterium]